MDREKILQIVGNKPRSTCEILKEVNNLVLQSFIKSFLSLIKEGKIEMIGFYSCQITGQEKPHYLNYSSPQVNDFLINLPRHDQRCKD